MEVSSPSVRFSQSVCIHCGRPVVGLPRESQQFGFVPAECQACHRLQLIEAKQRKAVGR